MTTPAREPAKRLTVRGKVIERRHMPVVEIFDERRECIARLDARSARQFAGEVALHAARSEADAMILRFFKRENFPDEAARALMEDFRVYRADIDGTAGKRQEQL